MIPFKSYKHMYEQQVNRAVWKVAGAAAAALLLNAIVLLWLVIPAYNKTDDAARELSVQRKALDELRQKPIVQQATESGIAGMKKRMPPRLLLSELTATIREVSAQHGVLYVKLQQEEAEQSSQQQANASGAADTEQAGQPAQPSNAEQNMAQFRLTMYGDLMSLIAFVTRLQHEEQLLIVDSIKYAVLDYSGESPALQLLAQLPSWRSGQVGYSLELTFKAFQLPASISSKFENTSIAMN